VDRISASLVTDSGGGNPESEQSYFSEDQWVFFAITYDSTLSSDNMKFYQGTTSQSVALVFTATVNGGAIRNAGNLLVLGNGANAVRAFPALFDNMRIFGSKSADSGALTLAEIEAYRSADVQNSSEPTLDGCVSDTTPPAITPTVTGSLGSNDWYVGDVSVTWSIVDNESAISSSTGCDATSITTDTSSVTLTCEATSTGGTSSESVTIKRDATAPSASAGASPGANAAGWRNSAVTVSFTGTDAMSGIASCDPAVVLSSDGANQSASGRCYDAAGNQSALATASGINIDMTPPTALATAGGPPPNSFGWRDKNVLVTFSGTDALSGIASCDPAITLSTEGTNLGASGRCYDRAGNASAPATVSGINIDKTDPAANIASPVQNATYNRNQVVIANYSCTDLLSGIAACTGSVANGTALDTSKKAANAKFIVTATDKAGNSLKLTVTYTVK
jgi:hypothetical protein